MGRPDSRRPARPSALRVFLGNGPAVTGLAILVLLALMVVVHPLLMRTLWADQWDVYHPVVGYDAPVVEATVVMDVSDPASEISLVDARRADITANLGDTREFALQPAPPSGRHWFGTDVFGRDVFSSVLAGTWPTFVVGMSAAFVSAVVAVLMAMASAVFGGRTDRVLSRLSDVLLLLPAPLAMIVLSAGSTGGLLSPLNFGIIYGVLAGAGGAAIVVRSHALAVVQRSFIDAARVAGARGWYLARRHLLPHLIPLAAVTVVASVVGAVVTHGFASWLGYSHELTNWGAVIFSAVGLSAIEDTFAWNALLAGAGAISLFCGGFYLLSLGLKEAAFRGSMRHVGQPVARSRRRLIPTRVSGRWR